MHRRYRHIEKVLLKRSRMFPVLGVLGARQVGKSTFLMEQWRQTLKANYITFDEKEMVQRAQRAPAQFLLDESANQETHLIIDEAHKVPHIFDSIKAIVDKKRRNGAFTLSGSVEFSSKSGVRESLAGRMGITKLYPMTLRELSSLDLYAPWVTFDFKNNQPLKPRTVETWLERGGMPIFCCFSDQDERIGIINSWLEAICYRDLKQLKDAEYDSETAFNLMLHIANNPNLSILKTASELGKTEASIKKHIQALESLFLIYKIPSLENPRARSKFTVLDAGVLNALRGKHSQLISRHESLITLVINEIYAQYEYSGKIKPELFYYRSKGGAEIDLVLRTRDKIAGIECLVSDDISPYMQRGMKSFLEKYKKATGYFIAPVQKPFRISDNLFVIPWDSIG